MKRLYFLKYFPHAACSMGQLLRMFYVLDYFSKKIYICIPRSPSFLVVESKSEHNMYISYKFCEINNFKYYHVCYYYFFFFFFYRLNVFYWVVKMTPTYIFYLVIAYCSYVHCYINKNEISLVF